MLFTTASWPAEQWPFGEVKRVRAESPLGFADELEQLRATNPCDVLLSFERVWSCDVYRAGDGVHRAWLERRARIGGWRRRVAQAVNCKHLATLRLEQSLFGRGSAGRVIANSHMVQSEIVQRYRYSTRRIDVVHNGVPAALFRAGASQRGAMRTKLGLTENDLAVLFVGSGWERKGLRFAIDAIEECGDDRMRLLIAGRGPQSQYKSRIAQFLGSVTELPPLYAAADIFLLPTIYDPFSNACLEALAAGVPVVTTRANGFAEIMRRGVDGSIVEAPDDLVSLCQALRFWSDAAKREETRALRFELAARYDMSANVEQTLAILLQAASAASTSS